MISWIGIDVSKAELSVWFHPQELSFNIPNTSAGYAQLVVELRGYEIQKVLLEATGGYERGILTALSQADYQVIRVNPRRARAFAQAIGKQAKTDPIDASVLARFAETLQSSTYKVVSPEAQALRDLVQQRGHFVQQRDDDKRRLLQARLPKVIALLKAHISYLQVQLKLLEQEIACAMNALNETKAAQLTSVKGIGMITAASLMAFLPELGELDRHQIAALAGLAPYNNDSGKFQGKRKIYGGRSAVRRVLYMACWIVIRYHEGFKARYEDLRQRGKSAKTALVACMRILLIRLNAMLRDGTEWKTQ